ncbi:MAG TPA: hypothetical protein VMF90_25965 [Rhizobiaceae bacterium]|nr:hypothetical protein [Rhizobiaceae bacterium]
MTKSTVKQLKAAKQVMDQYSSALSAFDKPETEMSEELHRQVEIARKRMDKYRKYGALAKR